MAYGNHCAHQLFVNSIVIPDNASDWILSLSRNLLFCINSFIQEAILFFCKSKDEKKLYFYKYLVWGNHYPPPRRLFPLVSRREGFPERV